jgi:hypothetical protein
MERQSNEMLAYFMGMRTRPVGIFIHAILGVIPIMDTTVDIILCQLTK